MPHTLHTRVFQPRATWWAVAIALCVFLPQSHSSLPSSDWGWNAFEILFCKEKVDCSLFMKQSTGQLEVQYCLLQCLKMLFICS